MASIDRHRPKIQKAEDAVLYGLGFPQVSGDLGLQRGGKGEGPAITSLSGYRTKDLMAADAVLDGLGSLRYLEIW